MKVLKTMKWVSMMFLLGAAVALVQPAHADVHSDVVLAGSVDSYTASFQGGQPAEVDVSGDGDTTLVLSVYDQNDHLIGRDTCRYADCTVTFRPIWTGQFTITVKNLGPVYNDYTVLTI